MEMQNSTVPAAEEVVVILKNKNTAEDCWICPKCETRNETGSARCVVCGTGEAEAAVLAFLPEENRAAKKPKRKFSEWLKENKTVVSAVTMCLLLVGIIAGCLISAAFRDVREEMSDGSYLVYKKEYGNVVGVEYYGSDDKKAEYVKSSIVTGDINYAMFFETINSLRCPTQIVYFSENELSAKRYLEYDENGNLIASTSYHADGDISASEKYYVQEGTAEQRLEEIKLNDFSKFQRREQIKYEGAVPSHKTTYDTLGRKTETVSYVWDGEIFEIKQFAYTEGGEQITYYCDASGKRTLMEEPDNTTWYYCYNDNGEYLYRTKDVFYMETKSADEALDFGGYRCYPDLYTPPVKSCIEFSYAYSVTEVSYGDPEGYYTLYVKKNDGRWYSIAHFEITWDGEEFSTAEGKVRFGTPTDLYGVLVIPDEEKDLSWYEFFDTNGFVIADYTY